MGFSFRLVVIALFLPITITQAQRREEVCTTNRNAPPASSYHWPVDAEVKVYFVRNMFTSEQRETLLEAMRTWTATGAETGAGVRFTYAGENDGPINCRNCLTVRRRDVHKRDKHHYAFFNPLSLDREQLLISAWIDLDFATTKPRAVQGFMAHELGHGMGLWDCMTCKKKRTIMNGFPGINKDNGLLGPSECDLETLKNVYRAERQAANKLITAIPKTKADNKAAQDLNRLVSPNSSERSSLSTSEVRRRSLADQLEEWRANF